MLLGHTADWHIMTRHLGVPRRGKDFTDAAERAVMACAKAGCDAIFNCGDVLNWKRPDSADIRSLNRIHKLLEREGLPMFTIEGNHDQASPPWSSQVGYEIKDVGEYDEESDTWEVRSSAAGLIDVTDHYFSWRGLKIHGAGALPSDWLKEKLTKRVVDIILWHGMVQQLIGFPNADSLSLDDIDLSGVRALLLGDIHIRNFLHKDGCLVGYPGATEVAKYRDPLLHSVTVIDTSVSPWSQTEVPIETRKVLAFRILTQEDLEAAVVEIREAASEHPIIFGRYNPHVAGVVCRINSLVDPHQAIVRMAPLPSGPLYREKEEAPAGAWERPLLINCLPDHFPEQTALTSLARELCQAHDNPAILLQNYIHEKLSV